MRVERFAWNDDKWSSLAVSLLLYHADTDWGCTIYENAASRLSFNLMHIYDERSAFHTTVHHRSCAVCIVNIKRRWRCSFQYFNQTDPNWVNVFKIFEDWCKVTNCLFQTDWATCLTGSLALTFGEGVDRARRRMFETLTRCPSSSQSELSLQFLTYKWAFR